MSSIKYCSPSSPFVLVGPHKLVCTSSNRFFKEYSFVLNSTFVYFQCSQCLHILFVGFVIYRISQTNYFLLILTRLSKYIWPILLCQSQLYIFSPNIFLLRSHSRCICCLESLSLFPLVFMILLSLFLIILN